MQVAPIAVVPRRRVLPFALVGLAVTSVAAIAAGMSEPAPRARVIDHRAVAPGTCADPVAGTWFAREYRADHGDWTEHELHIVKQGDDYVVDHVSHVRDGDRDGPARFHCAPDAFEFRTSGRAALDGDQLHVWGERLVERRARCDGSSMSYNLDSFTGPVSGERFDSVNNDGGTARNRPYRFRRIACE